MSNKTVYDDNRYKINNAVLNMMTQSPGVGIGYLIGSALGHNYWGKKRAKTQAAAEQAGLDAGMGITPAVTDFAANNRALDTIEANGGQMPSTGITDNGVPLTPQQSNQKAITMDNFMGGLQSPNGTWNDMQKNSQYNFGNTGVFTNGIRDLSSMTPGAKNNALVGGTPGGFNGYGAVLNALGPLDPKNSGAQNDSVAVAPLVNDKAAMQDTVIDPSRIISGGFSPQVDINTLTEANKAAETNLDSITKMAQQAQPFNANKAVAAATKFLAQKGYEPDEIQTMLIPYVQNWQERQADEYRTAAQNIMDELGEMRNDNPAYLQKIMELAKYDPAAAKLFTQEEYVGGRDRWNRSNKLDDVKTNVENRKDLAKFQNDLSIGRMREQLALRTQAEQDHIARTAALYQKLGYDAKEALYLAMGGGGRGGRGQSKATSVLNTPEFKLIGKQLSEIETAARDQTVPVTEQQKEFYRRWKPIYDNMLNTAYENAFGIKQSAPNTTQGANFADYNVFKNAVMEKNKAGISDEKFIEYVRTKVGLDPNNNNPNETINQYLTSAGFNIQNANGLKPTDAAIAKQNDADAEQYNAVNEEQQRRLYGEAMNAGSSAGFTHDGNKIVANSPWTLDSIEIQRAREQRLREWVKANPQYAPYVRLSGLA